MSAKACGKSPEISKKKPALMLVSCSAYSLTLKMEAMRPSETSIDFQWTT
jgi:hypothetical protein